MGKRDRAIGMLAAEHCGRHVPNEGAGIGARFNPQPKFCPGA